jgi:hypothetical protein
VLLLSLASLKIGLQADDFTMEDIVRHYGPFGEVSLHPIHPNPQANIGLRDQGRIPWWANETLRISLFRPLSFITHWVDFTFWANAPWIMHLENCLIYALLVVVVGVLYKDLGLPPIATGLATLFYAVNIGSAHSVGWIAGRNTILSPLFGFIALLAYHRGRVNQNRFRVWLGPLALAAALLSGEGGVAAFAYFIAYQIYIDKGQAIQRFVRLWPYALILAAWYLNYLYIGYGVHGSGWYLSNIHLHPGKFIIAIFTHSMIYLATQLTIPGAGLVTISPKAMEVGVALSIVILVFLYPVLKPVFDRRKEARFFLLGAVLSLIPLATTPPQDRIVQFVAYGICGIVALFIGEVSSAPMASRLQRGVSQLFMNIHGWFSTIAFIPFLFGCLSLGARADAIENALPKSSQAGVVLVNIPNDIALDFPRLMRERRGIPSPKYVYALYAGSSGIEVTRVNARTLQIHVERGWLATRIERVRNDLSIPFAVGQRVRLSDMEVEIQKVNRANAPVTALFRFHTPLDDPNRALFIWNERGPIAWKAPSIGDTVHMNALPPM